MRKKQVKVKVKPNVKIRVRSAVTLLERFK